MGLGLAFILSALIGAAGVGMNAYSNYKSNQQNINYQREANRENIETQERWRDYENQYNSPLYQMARYQDAGLNPNLIYGQQNLSASSGSPNQQAPTVNPYQAELTQMNDILDLLSYRERYEGMKLDNKLKGLDIVKRGVSNSAALADAEFENVYRKDKYENKYQLQSKQLERLNNELRRMKDNEPVYQLQQKDEHLRLKYRKELWDAGLNPDLSAPYWVKMLENALFNKGSFLKKLISR
ncbi:DNA pilot protein [Tortoise microvirus 106]|nr:DNA pilot protein [Tortoise microvirus 106]